MVYDLAAWATATAVCMLILMRFSDTAPSSSYSEIGQYLPRRRYPFCTTIDVIRAKTGKTTVSNRLVRGRYCRQATGGGKGRRRHSKPDQAADIGHAGFNDKFMAAYQAGQAEVSAMRHPSIRAITGKPIF